MFVLIMSRTICKWVMSAQTPGTQINSLQNIQEANSFSPIPMKLGPQLVMIKFWTILKMGHIGSKAMTLDQV